MRSISPVTSTNSSLCGERRLARGSGSQWTLTSVRRVTLFCGLLLFPLRQGRGCWLAGDAFFSGWAALRSSTANWASAREFYFNASTLPRYFARAGVYFDGRRNATLLPIFGDSIILSSLVLSTRSLSHSPPLSQLSLRPPPR